MAFFHRISDQEYGVSILKIDLWKHAEDVIICFLP